MNASELADSSDINTIMNLSSVDKHIGPKLKYKCKATCSDLIIQAIRSTHDCRAVFGSSLRMHICGTLIVPGCAFFNQTKGELKNGTKKTDRSDDPRGP